MSEFPEPGPRGAAPDLDEFYEEVVRPIAAREAEGLHRTLGLGDDVAVSFVARRADERVVTPTKKQADRVFEAARRLAKEGMIRPYQAGLAEASLVSSDAEPGETDEHGAWGVLSVDGDYAREHDPELAAAQSEEPRQSRRHANAKGDREDRRFDTTALHYDQHGRLVSHADYIAHCEKYDYVWRSIKSGDRILDVGCGTDAPLMRAINFVQSQAAKVMLREGGCYVGVDMNPLKKTNINWAQLVGNVDMTSDEGYQTAYEAIPQNQGLSDSEAGYGYTMIVCLEVIEHMSPEDGRALLTNMKDLLSGDGRVVLSTPVYDGKGQARNHIHEYYVDELRELVQSAGFRVARRMGTFTSEPQVKAWLKANRPDWLEVYLAAREFHSSGYMSGLFAPMLPDQSRNNVWVLEHA